MRGALFVALALGAATAVAADDPRERAREAMREGRWTDAIDAWRAHLRRRPGDDEARTAFARALAGAGRNREALAELRGVLARYPRDVEVRALLARILAWSGDLAAAIREAEGGLAIDPRSVDARLVLADALVWKGRPGEALPHYVRALEKRDDPDARKRYARALLAAGRPEAAEREARRVLRSAPGDREARELAQAAELASLRGIVEVALTAFEAGKVHPWWRAQVSGRWRLRPAWDLGGGIEHLWRDFQPRDAPAPAVGPPPGFVRDTVLWVDATYRPPGRLHLYAFLGGAPQATFTPRVAFEISPGYEVTRGLVLGAGYKGLGYEGQLAHLFMPTLSWYVGDHYLLVRYYLAVVQPYGTPTAVAGIPPPASAQVGHAGMLRLGGRATARIGWFAGLAGGLAFVTAALGPITSPAVSAFAGLELCPTSRNGLRIEYEYVNENVGSGPRLGVTWHGLRVAFYRRF